MTSISVEEAQAKLSELIAQLGPGEELDITKDQKTIAKLVRQKKQRVFGLGKGKLTIVSEGDEHLNDFSAYMPR